MKKITFKKIIGISLLIIGIIFAWSGMIYSTNNINNFHPSGILVAIVGYCFVPLGVHIYETTSE